MAIHIKNHWNNDAVEHSLQDTASVVAFTAWRIAKDRAINLNSERFIYTDDAQRMAVIGEYLYFQLHVVDRLAHQLLGEEERGKLILYIALKFADYIQDNGQELFGDGDYIRPFIARLNQRSAEYSEFNFTDQRPSYPALRHFGYQIQQLMGEIETNRWIIDQIMDRDGEEVYKQIAQAVSGLLPAH